MTTTQPATGPAPRKLEWPKPEVLKAATRAIDSAWEALDDAAPSYAMVDAFDETIVAAPTFEEIAELYRFVAITRRSLEAMQSTLERVSELAERGATETTWPVRDA